MSKNEAIDKLISRRMSRRAFNKTLSAAGLAVVAVPLLPRSASAAEAIYFTWSGYDIPELFPSYLERHGASPNLPLFADNEETFTKLLAGFKVDVTHPCSSMIPRWRAANLLQAIDTSRLSNWPNVFPTLKDLPGTQFDGEQWFVPFDWGQTSITYRTDIVDWQGQEESWSLLWDERYKGKLATMAGAEDAWWCTAIYAGVDVDNVTDEDMKKVRALLEKQRPLLRFYSNDTTTVEQGLASGELVAAMTWNESPLNLTGQGIPVKFANVKEGALTWCCGLVLVKDAPEYEKAHDLIDAMIGVRPGQFLISEYGYGHSNEKAFDLVSAEDLEARGLSKKPLEILNRGVFVNPVPPEIETRINREWEEIVAGF